MVKKHYFFIFSVILIFSTGLKLNAMDNWQELEENLEQVPQPQQPIQNIPLQNPQPQQPVQVVLQQGNQPQPNAPAPKARWSFLSPAKWLLKSKSPVARYTRYGIAAAVVGTALFYPDKVAPIVLKDNLYHSIYQGVRYGFGDFVGNVYNAPRLKFIGLSLLHTALGLKAIKEVVKGTVSGTKKAYSETKKAFVGARNWCTSWFTEPTV